MVLRAVYSGSFGVALLLSVGASTAAEYRAEEFLRLDLSKAVLSPKPLGSGTEFAPVAVEADSDRCSEDDPDVVTAEPTVPPPQRQAAASAHGETPKRATRRRLTHRRRNPLDAQAMDTRIQAWPCRSGGICNWKQ